MASSGTRVGSVLARARRRAGPTSDEIAAFSERIRLLADPPEMDPDPRNVELRLAAEELRAQNEELADLCSLLERERAKYLSIFLDAPDAYLATSARGVIAEANVAAGTLLGMEPGFLRGKLLIAFVARKDVHPFREHVRALEQLRDGSSAFSVRLRERSAGVFSARMSVRAIRAEDDGRIVGHLWTVRRTGEENVGLKQALAALEELADIARLPSSASSWPARESMLLGEEVAAAVEQIAGVATARRVRLVAPRLQADVRVMAQPARLRRAMHLLMNVAASSVPVDGELHVRLEAVRGEACLELATETGCLEVSDVEILALAAQLAADAGRFGVPADAVTSLMCRVVWPIV